MTAPTRIVPSRAQPRSVWLMYHDVTPTGANSAGRPDVYSLSTRRFAQHLDAIVASGLASCTAGDWLAAPSGDAVVMTFDDGWRGTFETALPLVAARGLSCTVFVTRDFVGRPHGCDVAMLREAAAVGVEIGIHGTTHRLFSTLDAEEVTRELAECRSFLEDALGRPVDIASAPGGDWLPWMVPCARRAGLRAVSTSRPGLVTPATDRYALGRVALRRSDDARTVARLCRLNVRRPWLRYHALRLPRAALGAARYERLRRRTLGSLRR